MKEITENISPTKEIQGIITTTNSEISGNIASNSSEINGNITPINSKVDGDITIIDSEISGDITYGIGGSEAIPTYKGEYTVLPLAFKETVLSTKDTKLTKDIVIKEIPYYETSNTSGGSTVYIAGQIEFG